MDKQDDEKVAIGGAAVVILIYVIYLLAKHPHTSLAIDFCIVAIIIVLAVIFRSIHK